MELIQYMFQKVLNPNHTVEVGRSRNEASRYNKEVKADYDYFSTVRNRTEKHSHDASLT